MKQHLHEKRKITFQELGALLATRELLKLGLLKHSSDSRSARAYRGDHLFNMSTSGCKTDCGSIGCLGGNMALVMGIPYFGDYIDDGRSEALHPLFFPEHSLDWDSITPKQAIVAIDRFLAGKKPWVKPTAKKTVKKKGRNRR